VPKEVPITRRVLIEITRILIDEGWELMRREDIARDVYKYGLQHHRYQPRNIGFKKSDGKGHVVKLWLSCDYDLAVEYKKTMPLLLDLPVSFPYGIGMAWALIVDANGRAIYYATPRNRSQNFKENFLWNARITWKRVENWPPCPKCPVDAKVNMEIIEKQNHGNFWACYRTKDHADGMYAKMDWNFSLTPEERAIKNAEYRKRAKGRRKAKKEAKIQEKPAPRKAHDIRIPWKERQKVSAA